VAVTYRGLRRTTRRRISSALMKPLPRTATDYGVHGLFQVLRVVDTGRRVGHRQRDASLVDHNGALRALFALIRRVRGTRFLFTAQPSLLGSAHTLR
jgi:hypothetical protein